MDNPYRHHRQDIVQARLDNSQDGLNPTTNFTEAASTAYKSYYREESSISEINNYYAARRPRDDKLDQLIKDGTISSDIVDSFTEKEHDFSGISYPGKVERGELDRAALAEWAYHEGLDIKTDAQLEAEMRESFKVQREADQETFRNADGWGKAGAVVGGIAAAGVDPLNLISMVVPGAQARAGATIGQAVVRGAGYGLATNAAVEAALQTQVVQYKDKIDSPYDWSDGLVNIGFAAGAGAVLGGALAGGSQALTNRARGQQIDRAAAAIDERRKDVVPDSPEDQALVAQREAIKASRYQEMEMKGGQTEFGAADDIGIQAREHARIRSDAVPDRPVEMGDGVQSSTKAEIAAARKDRETIEQVIACMTGAVAGG